MYRNQRVVTGMPDGNAMPKRGVGTKGAKDGIVIWMLDRFTVAKLGADAMEP